MEMEMDRKLTIVRILLYPLSLLYGMGVAFRNWLFNVGILKAESFDVPVISVGNITVGGTGKTPMTEYLISMLSETNSVGVLSRGYKRKTSGYVCSTVGSTAREIGDEPCQMKRKFPNVMVCVDANRRRGIRQMLKSENKPEVILLDDAFQHRYVKAGISILLMDYGRLATDDELLPLGTLREPLKAKNRANIVVVNKCPHDIKPIELRIIRKKLRLFPYQVLYFTYIDYKDISPLFPQEQKSPLDGATLKRDGYSVLCLSGIANPLPFYEYVRALSSGMETVEYGDHHDFSAKELEQLSHRFSAMPAERKVIITTEKDGMRLKDNEKLPHDLKKYIYYIPLQLKFLNGENRNFDNIILDYVDRNR